MIGAAALIPPRFTAIVTYVSAVTVVSLAIYLFCAVDAARLAGRPGEAPRWYVMAGAVIAVWLCGAVAGAAHRAHQAAVAVADVFDAIG